MSSIEKKVDQIMAKPFQSTKSLDELIKLALTDDNINNFFNLIEDNLSIKKLIFLHKIDLFGYDNIQNFPYLYFSDFEKSKRKEKIKESNALIRILTTEQGLIDKGIEIPLASSILGASDQEKSIFLNSIKEILFYHLINLIRNNKPLLELINIGEYSYEVLRGYFKTYPDLEIEKTLKKLFEDESLSDPIILKKQEHLILGLMENVAKNSEGFLNSIPKVLPNYVFQLHRFSKNMVEKMLYSSSLSYNDYKYIITELLRYDLIDNKDIVLWCESCSHNGMSYNIHKGKLAPEKIIKSKCINCNKSYSFSTFYSFNPNIKEMIFHKDGILAVYFGWLLKSKKIEFKTSVKTKKFECDFLVQDKILIECKVFKNDKDAGALNTELSKTLKQLNDHLQELIDEGKKITNIYILWNRDETHVDILNEFNNQYNDLFVNYNIKIISIEKIERIINKIKSKAV